MRASSLCVLTGALALTAFGNAQAGAKIDIDDTRWVSVGAGIRTSFTSVEDGSPSGDERSSDFFLESTRLYLNAQLHEFIKLEFNTEIDEPLDFSDDDDVDIRVLDAIVKFEYNDYVNVWAGRHLPPSDRANLDGPYYLNAWTFPIVQAYPAIFAGRDEGVLCHGQTGGGVFHYAFGVYDGIDGSSTPNQDDELLYAARFSYSFLDPEPGYYTTSSYFGAKDVLTLGVAMQSQDDATGVMGDPGDFFGWNIDLLAEKKVFGTGAVSLEGAYYDYDHDDKAPFFGYQGDGYFVLVSFLAPQTLGIGQLQPHFRYQEVDDDNAADRDQWEAGLGYIIDGQNAKVVLTYGETDVKDGGPTSDFVILGAQLQI